MRRDHAVGAPVGAVTARQRAGIVRHSRRPSLAPENTMNPRRALLATLLIATLLAPSAAFADVPLEPSEPAASELTPAERARAADAAIDRGFVSSHAETIGGGNWSINVYQLFFLGVTHAFSDDFQVALTTSLPVFRDFPFLIALSPKGVVYRSPNTVVAVRGLVWWGTILGGGGDGGLGAFSAGLVIDQYLDPGGRIALHASLSAGGAFGTNLGSSGFELGSGVLLQFDVGLSVAVARIVKLVVEAQTFAANVGDGFRFAPVALINYGIRFFGEDLAADLGFFRPVGDIGDDPFILGFPFVAFSARF